MSCIVSDPGSAVSSQAHLPILVVVASDGGVPLRVNTASLDQIGGDGETSSGLPDWCGVYPV